MKPSIKFLKAKDFKILFSETLVKLINCENDGL